MATLGKVIGVGLGGGILAFGLAMRRGFAEASEAEKVLAQTQAVIKSTGGAAGVTAKHVNKLATSLGLMTGIDDEAIASAQNLLLTFTQIQNVKGGPQIFDEATKAVLDMDAALTSVDLQGAAMMVGKALNQMDLTAQGNVRGFMALRRVGVQVTPQMMAQAAAFIKANKPMKAQMLLLKELNKEFGGSAKAFGGTMTGALGRLRNAFDELMAAFAQGFLPLIIRVSNALTKRLMDPAFIARVQHLGTLIGTTLFNAFVKVKSWMDANWPGIKNVFQETGRFIKVYVIPPLKLALRLVERLYGMWLKVKGIIPTMNHKVTTPEQVKKLPAWAQEQIQDQVQVGPPAGKKPGKKKPGDSGLYQGPRAKGGPVMAGMSYMVGERGPEMFVPGQSGSIVPNGAFGGVVIQNLSLPGVTNPRQFLSELQRIGKRGTAQQRGRHGGQNLALG